MNRMGSRVAKIEGRNGDDTLGPWIVYSCDETDTPGTIAATRAAAVAEWEATNGPLGEREPKFIERCFLSPRCR